MNPNPPSWDAIYKHADFHALTLRRRWITLRLFLVGMAFFFSIPLLSRYFPDFLALKITGSINMGLLYVLAQYVVGGLIAWRYVVQLRRVDAMTSDLIERLRQSGLLPA